jgi:hypothetical protein
MRVLPLLPAFLIVLAAAATGCATAPGSRHVASEASSAPSAARSVGPGGGGRASGPERLRPDLTLTPGAVDPGCDLRKVCVPGYADGNGDEQGVRNVDDATKRLAFQRYGLENADPSDYEVDHLISLELCGSNVIENLWPESYAPVPGAHEKDRVEDSLHDQVCKNEISLEDAQRIIRTDWYSEYLKLQSAGDKKAPRSAH